MSLVKLANLSNKEKLQVDRIAKRFSLGVLGLGAGLGVLAHSYYKDYKKRNSIKDELMSSLNNEEKNTITDKEAYNKADKIFEKRLYSGKDPHMNRYNKMYNKYIPD